MSGGADEQVLHLNLASTSSEDDGCVRFAVMGGIVIFGLPALCFLLGAIGTLGNAFTQPSVEGVVITAILAALGLGSAFIVYRLVRYFQARSVTVGSDGLTLNDNGGRRFLSFTQIQRIETDAMGVVLVLRAGHLRLPVSKFSLDDARAERKGANLRAARSVLKERIEHAHALATTKSEAGRIRELLDRSGRPLHVWKADLKRLAAPIPQYREVAYDPADLVRVAEDVAEVPERRVAAAIAVRAAGDERMAERIRVAADGCIDTDLKRALDEAIAEGEVLEHEITRATARRL